MKKIFKYAYLSAIALTGAVGFSACASGDEIVDNPDYNPETKSVKTAITLNIGRGSAITRMADGVTQNDGSFRGMEKVYIYPALAEITSTNLAISSSVITDNSISGITSTNSLKTYSGVDVPINTSHFLFYGKATNTASTVDDKLANGYTTTTFPAGTTAGDFLVQAVPIVGTTYSTTTEWTTPVTQLKAYLNSIATVTGWSTATNPRLNYLYTEFTKTNKNRAGSAPAVLATVQWLYDEMYSISSGDAATIAGNVIAAITNTTYVSTSGTGAGLKLSWSGTMASYTSFPENLGIPSGAAQYQYKNTGSEEAPVWAFDYVPTATLNASNTAVENFVYPNELYYFTMTNLKATPGAVSWPTTTSDWADATWESWTNKVENNSKNIALVNNIQYGTAQLAAYVKSVPVSVVIEGDSKPVLYDNAKELDATSSVNKPIIYSDGCFPLTAVIIGAQPTKVGWNFLPTTGASGASFTCAVYDNHMTSTISANETNGKSSSATDYEDGYCGPNNTLVFDNLGAAEGTVSVCLEFVNNTSSDFYGKDDVIKKGQKFYLIGKLDPTSKTLTMNTPDVYYPSTDVRVFVQDYTTKAKFQITAGNESSKGSLAHAYSSIPDLRTTTQEIGLSVDLVWTPGLAFSDIVLGE
jgi:hypothetical protein